MFRRLSSSTLRVVKTKRKVISESGNLKFSATLNTFSDIFRPLFIVHCLPGNLLSRQTPGPTSESTRINAIMPANKTFYEFAFDYAIQRNEDGN